MHRTTHAGQRPENGIVIKTHSICDGCAASDDSTPSGFNTPANKGLCLNPSPGSTAERVQCHTPSDNSGGSRRAAKRQSFDLNLCCGGNFKPYHKAVVLVRHPLDVIKSNFHFRRTSLHMLNAKFDYDFVVDRAMAWVQLYQR